MPVYQWGDATGNNDTTTHIGFGFFQDATMHITTTTFTNAIVNATGLPPMMIPSSPVPETEFSYFSTPVSQPSAKLALKLNQ